ncbi:MAG: lipopolysaccharide biosynthesis protein [Planctomycetia bacterium]|nr:lipopolysaccharide biosynthesis protein [Planctomycetia bacterium]
MSDKLTETKSDAQIPKEERLDLRSFRAALWVMIFQFTQQFFQIVLGIVMIRILSPSEYGIWGMLAIYCAIFVLFSESGFTEAIVQKKEITDIDLSTIFYFNLFLCTVMAVIVYFSAEPAAYFFREPRLVLMIKIFAPLLLIAPMGAIQTAVLARDLRQGTATLSGLAACCLALPAALIIAWKGGGCWALFIQFFLTFLLRNCFLVLQVRWYPRLQFSRSSLKQVLSFGMNFLLSNIMVVISENINNIVIGRAFPARQLGFFDRSKALGSLWPISIFRVLASIVFSSFSKIQEDRVRLESAFFRVLTFSAFVLVFPSMLVCTLSRPLIELVFTSKWLPLVPGLWLFSIIYIIVSLSGIHHNLLLACGRGKTYAKLVIFERSMLILNAFLMIRCGIIPLIAGTGIIFFTGLCFCVYLVKREIDFSLFKLIRTIFPYLFYTFISCSVSWLMYRAIYPVHPWCGFLLSVFTGCVFYILLNRIFKSAAYCDLIRLLGDLLKRPNPPEQFRS